MPRYTVAQARQHLADVLNAAEEGQRVVIERRGIRFTLQLAEEKPAPRKSEAVIEWSDEAIENGNWTWKLSAQGLAFSPRKRSRR